MIDGRAREMSPGTFAALAAAAALAAVVAVLPSAGGGFIDSGDVQGILRNPRTASAAAALSGEGEGVYTPVAAMSFVVDRALFGDSAVAMRIHGLAAAGLFVLFAALLAAKMTGSRAVGALAGILLAVHPLAVEPKAWISARPVLMSGCMLAISGLLWLPGMERRGPVARWRMVGSLLAFALAALAHPIALAWPFMLMVLAASGLGAPPGPRRRLAPAAAFLAPAALLAVAHALKAGPPEALMEIEHAPGAIDVLLLSAAATGWALRCIVAPLGLGPDYATTLATDPSFGAVSLVALIAAAGIAWRLRERLPELALFVLWTLLTVTPAALLRRGSAGDGLALWSLFGACVLASGLLARLWARLSGSAPARAAVAVPVVALAVTMLVASMVAAHRWADPLRLWAAVAAARPESPRAHLHMGALLAARSSEEQAAGRAASAERGFRAARAEVQKALALGASEMSCRLVLGTLFFRWEYYGEASEHLVWIVNHAKALPPAERRRLTSPAMLADVNVALGAIYESACRSDEAGDSGPDGQRTMALAKAHFEEALEHEPGRADAKWRLGRILNRLGEFPKAVELLTDAAEATPDDPRVHADLARALENTFDYEAASAAYERASELDQMNPSYRNSVARMRQALGNVERSRRSAEEEGKSRMEAAKAFEEGRANEARAAKALDAPAGTEQETASREAESTRLLREAYKAYKLAEARRPDFAAAHQRAGVVAFRLGLYDEARSHLEAADIYQPRNLGTCYALARTHLKLARLDDAEEKLVECVNIDRNLGLAYLWLARIVGLYREKPDYDDALIHAATAVKLGAEGAGELQKYLLQLKAEGAQGRPPGGAAAPGGAGAKGPGGTK